MPEPLSMTDDNGLAAGREREHPLTAGGDLDPRPPPGGRVN